ncbi:MAG TPA: trigger factor [Flavobacteriales bacterium]|nr:trigger factor [Flavobacteriales bacterium]
MQIEKKDLDNLSSQISIKIDEKDYADKVEKKLKDYKKNMEMPGFRKGKVPMNLIKQKYERALIADEVNNQMQEALNKYLQDNKIAILGYPIPSKEQKDIDWATAKEFDFNYDIGLAPELEVDLSKVEGITDYKITADDKMIDKEVAQIQQQYGSFSDLDEAKEDSFVLGTFTNEDENINSQTTVNMADLTDNAKKQLLGKKKGDVVEFNSADLYKDPHTMMHALNIDHDRVHGLNVPLKFEVNGVFELKPAEINKELLDKVFGEGKIEDEAGLRQFIKDDIEKQLEQTADNQLLNDVTEKLLETVDVELPADFLKRWIEVDSQGKITGEQAEEEYKKAEKGLKYQLIEEAVAKKYGIKVTYDDLLNLVKDLLKLQMLQYGQALPDEAQIEEIAHNVLKNEEEVKRLSDQIIKKKLVGVYKEHIPVQKEEISYDKFLDLNK